MSLQSVYNYTYLSATGGLKAVVNGLGVVDILKLAVDGTGVADGAQPFDYPGHSGEQK